MSETIQTQETTDVRKPLTLTKRIKEKQDAGVITRDLDAVDWMVRDFHRHGKLTEKTWKLITEPHAFYMSNRRISCLDNDIELIKDHDLQKNDIRHHMEYVRGESGSMFLVHRFLRYFGNIQITVPETAEHDPMIVDFVTKIPALFEKMPLTHHIDVVKSKNGGLHVITEVYNVHNSPVMEDHLFVQVTYPMENTSDMWMSAYKAYLSYCIYQYAYRCKHVSTDMVNVCNAFYDWYYATDDKQHRVPKAKYGFAYIPFVMDPYDQIALMEWPICNADPVIYERHLNKCLPFAVALLNRYRGLE